MLRTRTSYMRDINLTRAQWRILWRTARLYRKGIKIYTKIEDYSFDEFMYALHLWTLRRDEARGPRRDLKQRLKCKKFFAQLQAGNDRWATHIEGEWTNGTHQD